MIEVGIIIALVFLNAIFVASEFGILVVPRASVEKMAADGDISAKMIQQILKDPVRQDRYIATSQIGVTAASLGLGMYGEHVLAEWVIFILKATSPLEVGLIHALSSTIAIVILTYFHVVLGEMIPKSLAIQRAEPVMLLLVGPMKLCTKIFWPLILVLNGANNFLLKRFMKIDREKATVAAFDPDEIQLIVKESETEGIISDEIGTVIEQVFDFGELTAEDIMVPRVHVTALPVHPDTATIKETLKTHPHSRYPVYSKDKDNIVGSVHVKDLAQLMDSDGQYSFTIRPVPFVPLHASLQTVLENMKQMSTHIAVVLDEHGGTAGIITMQDIFEEVIGEIDESLTPPSIEVLSDGALRAEGTVRLEELAEKLEVNIEDENATTISGLVLDKLGRPPRVGDRIEHGRISVEVARVKGRGVRTCIIRRLPAMDDDNS